MIPQHILYGAGGTVSVNASARPTAATVTIKTGEGSAVVEDEAATVSTINTTLSAAAVKGAAVLALASATGVSCGSDILLASPPETVRVKSISGTDATLWRPVINDHASGVAATGTMITYTVSAGDAATLFFDGRCEWTLDSVLTHVTSCECTKYPLVREVAATEVSLYDEAPSFHLMLSEGDDTLALLDNSHAEVLQRIGGKARIRVYTGSELFRQATVFAVMRRLYRSRPGDSAREMYERYTAEMNEAIERLQGYAPRDGDQDGRIEENERISMRSARILRG